MRVVHKWKNVKKEGSGNGAFLLSSEREAFFADGIDSRYKGFYFFKKDWFKTVHSIKTDKEVKSIANYFSHVEKLSSIRESYFLPLERKSLVYQTNKEHACNLIIDCKKMFDNSDHGRHYSHEKNGKRLIVKYEKKEGDKYSLFIVISGFQTFTQIEKWEKEEHSFDKRRNSHPWENYVYNFGRFFGDKLIITSSSDKKEAIEENEFVVKNLDKLKQEKINSLKLIKKKEISQAAAYNSLLQLKGNDYFYAGFPWFLQYWSRDMLVSLGTLIKEEDFSTTKEILFTYLKQITADGRLANRIPASELASADSIGWLWKRISDFLHALRGKKIVDKYVDSSEFKLIKEKLEKNIELLEKYHCEHGLLFSKAKETWMDTTDIAGTDTRLGARIEMQAMLLKMYSLAHELTGKQIYQKKENDLKQKVLSLFFTGKILKDGALDATQRPNIFIAHYIYPDLLGSNVWKIVFQNNLERTWLEWGGLSSMSKQHPLFQSFHTGEDNRSYHRGDSWFWINNLAAISLIKVDKKYFSDYVKKIKKASEEEILWHGFIGAHAEISSASKMESFGCWNQLWSNAMYLEFCDELRK